MKEAFRQLLAEEHITEFGFLPLSHAKIIHPHLLPSGIKTVVMLAVPYDTCEQYTDGVSAYAHITDYHRYFSELFERILPKLQTKFKNEVFYGAADHSPIAEKDAAAKAGLGLIGCHSLLINPKYGSYVFLGSIFTSMEIPCDVREAMYCNACGTCINACPAHAVSKNGIDPMRCFSALSQKKNLTEDELLLLRQNHIAWGCDRCQTACPYNSKRIPTDIPFFVNNRHRDFCAAEIEAMTEEFLHYAFSWRGKNRIVQNLQNLVDD